MKKTATIQRTFAHAAHGRAQGHIDLHGNALKRQRSSIFWIQTRRACSYRNHEGGKRVPPFCTSRGRWSVTRCLSSESRAIRARCANCACCACYACCRWQVCQPPKRARTYIRTTIVPIVPIVLFCTRASLPVRILTYVRTYTRGNLNTHARTTRGNLNTYARTTAEAIETSTHV